LKFIYNNIIYYYLANFESESETSDEEEKEKLQRKKSLRERSISMTLPKIESFEEKQEKINPNVFLFDIDMQKYSEIIKVVINMTLEDFFKKVISDDGEFSLEKFYIDIMGYDNMTSGIYELDKENNEDEENDKEKEKLKDKDNKLLEDKYKDNKLDDYTDKDNNNLIEKNLLANEAIDKSNKSLVEKDKNKYINNLNNNTHKGK
jgi:hypothetical protein